MYVCTHTCVCVFVCLYVMSCILEVLTQFSLGFIFCLRNFAKITAIVVKTPKQCLQNNNNNMEYFILEYNKISIKSFYCMMVQYITAATAINTISDISGNIKASFNDQLLTLNAKFNIKIGYIDVMDKLDITVTNISYCHNIWIYMKVYYGTVTMKLNHFPTVEHFIADGPWLSLEFWFLAFCKKACGNTVPDLPDLLQNSARQVFFFKWASSWDYGTYHIGDQRRLRRACAFAPSHQSLRCLHK